MSEQQPSSSSPLSSSVASQSTLQGGPENHAYPALKPMSNSGSFEKRLTERTARFKNIPHIAMPQARTGCLQIAGGLSPAALLDSPVLLPSTQAEPSPTTGTFPLPPFFHGGGTRVASSDLSRDRTTEDNALSNFVFKPFPANSQRVEARVAPLFGLPIAGQLIPYGAPVVPGHGDGGIYDSQQSTTPEDNGRSTPPLIEKPAEDGYNWRKYGQKQVKGSEYPRSYYKCTHPGCPVKKKVERSEDGQVTQRVYKGKHNHPKPMPSRRVSVLHTTLGLDIPDIRLSLTNGEQETTPQDGADEQQRGSGWQGMGARSGNESTDLAIVPASGNSGSYEPGQAGSQRGWNGDQVSDSSEDVGEDDGPGSRPGADDDQQEADNKRRKLDKRDAITPPGIVQKPTREPRLVIQATSEVEILDDGYRWRKYGQKVVKGNPHPRSYYKCTSANCPVRKHVERSSVDPKEVITTYEGKHNHDVPALRARDDQNKEGGNGGAAGTPGSGISTSNTCGPQTPLSLVSENNNLDEGDGGPGVYRKLVEGNEEGEDEAEMQAKEEAMASYHNQMESNSGLGGELDDQLAVGKPRPMRDSAPVVLSYSSASPSSCSQPALVSSGAL